MRGMTALYSMSGLRVRSLKNDPVDASLVFDGGRLLVVARSTGDNICEIPMSQLSYRYARHLAS